MGEQLHDGLVKVFFEPPDDPNEDWHTKVESMWAKPILERGATGGVVYELDNSPWYVFGVSLRDQVCAQMRREVFDDPEHDEYDVLYFTHVWKRSGHSTYTLFLQGDTTTESPEWTKYWSRISAMGCYYEGMNKRLLSIDVPPGTVLSALEEIFEEALAANVFAYQTQHRFEGIGGPSTN